MEGKLKKGGWGLYDHKTLWFFYHQNKQTLIVLTLDFSKTILILTGEGG